MKFKVCIAMNILVESEGLDSNPETEEFLRNIFVEQLPDSGIAITDGDKQYPVSLNFESVLMQVREIKEQDGGA